MSWQLPLTAAAVVAVVLPTIVAFNLPPSSTFFNQACALIGWGLFVGVLAPVVGMPMFRARSGTTALLAVFALLLLEALASYAFNGLPSSLALSTAGLIGAAAIAVVAGAAARQSPRSEVVFRSLCIALLAAGMAGTAIAVVQVFFPALADSNIIAATAYEGRGSGNLRQPNHLSSLLIWALIAAVWLWQTRALPVALCATAGAALVFGVVLTASRTGVLGIAMLLAWGICDRRLPKSLRVALWLTPVVYLACFEGMAVWSQETHQVFGGAVRATTEGDISSSRFAIWSNTLSLIAQHPLLGVGLGEFNFAWSLTPFPHRPVAFFDHTHNLPLQFMVELGVPMGLFILGLLIIALVDMYRSCTRPDEDDRGLSMTRAGLAIVLLIAVHSLLEYPLWYSYFLLPAAFVFGFCCGGSRPALSGGTQTVQAAASHGLLVVWLGAGVLLVVGGLAAVIDYQTVAAIFSSGSNAPLAERIRQGQRSWFFAHHADYAAVTTVDHPSTAMPSFKVATHNLLDTRLMIAWAKAYAEQHDLDRARYIAMRLREFRNEDAEEFFEPCTSPDRLQQSVPFQCETPQHQLSYRDFR